MSNLVVCRKCKYFKAKERNVSLKFKGPIEEMNLPEGHPEPLSNYIRMESAFAKIPMCHHEDCFEVEISSTPEFGPKKEKVRIAGQAQLNPTNECTRFKLKWRYAIINWLVGKTTEKKK